MAWTWLVAVDGILALGVLGVALWLFTMTRTRAAMFFGVAALMAAFRFAFFVIPNLFGPVMNDAWTAVYIATESVLGVALVGAMLTYTRGPLPLGRGAKILLLVFFLGALFSILLQVQENSAIGPFPWFAGTYLPAFFVTATLIAGRAWLVTIPVDLRRPLLPLFAAMFAWSLNDAIRIGHASWSAGNPANLTRYTGILAGIWLAVLVVLLAAVIRDGAQRGWRAPIPAWFAFVGAGAVLALVQMATSDPLGMRAIHLVLDSAAILTIGATIAVYGARVRLEEPTSRATPA